MTALERLETMLAAVRPVSPLQEWIRREEETACVREAHVVSPEHPPAKPADEPRDAA